MVTSAERPLNHSVYAARYNAPTSPPGGRMPLVRRAILQRIATVSGPLQPTEKCVWKLGALLENWIASIRIGEGRNERRGKGNFFFLIFGGDLYSLSFRFIYGICDSFTSFDLFISLDIVNDNIENTACNFSIRLFGIEET